jgi:hypothetical protein
MGVYIRRPGALQQHESFWGKRYHPRDCGHELNIEIEKYVYFIILNHKQSSEAKLIEMKAANTENTERGVTCWGTSINFLKVT